MKNCDIQIRDPFILPVQATGDYYLFGSTDKNTWSGPAQGFDCYRGKDLENWEGPIPAFRPGKGFWSTINFWAPEVHFYQSRYYMFASFKEPGHYRGTQILTSDVPSGPYRPLTEGPVTPDEWECLDGTLHVDAEGMPWIVFCHEWVQVHNGAIYTMRLSPDLKRAAARPVFLFNASESPWLPKRTSWPAADSGYKFPTYVTDGPFLYRTRDGSLLMIWSSHAGAGYAMGTARSVSGRIDGPWIHDVKPLWTKDGGHGMIFRTFDGRLMLTLHTPNQTPKERAIIVEIVDTGSAIRLK